jgi:GH15 family glucan-1,4-alpha-glucosidase
MQTDIIRARPDKNGRVIPEFDKWNYATTKELAKLKKGIVNGLPKRPPMEEERQADDVETGIFSVGFTGPHINHKDARGAS